MLLLLLAGLVVLQSSQTSATQHTTSDSSQAGNARRSHTASDAELWLIRDHVKEGDKLLKELMQERYQSVKERLVDGDARLKEQLVEGDALLKEQLQDSSSKLKEQLSREGEWLKEQLSREEARVKEELKQGADHRTEELQEQSQALKNMRKLITEWTKRNDATIMGLKEEVSHLATQLQTTTGSLQTTRDRLRGTQTELAVLQDTLQATQDNLQSTREDLKTTRKALENSTAELQATKEDLQTTKEDLQTTKEDLHTTKDKLQTATGQLEATDNKITALQNSPFPGLSEQTGDPFFYDFTGSTFIRWGRLTCPGNTTLVYAGVIGGSWHAHEGGATSHLCLTPTPQFTSLKAGGNSVHGSEYEGMSGHTTQDAVCSLCRTPQATTIMIPGTFVCPEGWSLQYSGYIAASPNNHKRGTDYICLDENIEDRVGGHVNHEGNNLYYATAACGSLPCPPYINGRTVTCAVCSM